MEKITLSDGVRLACTVTGQGPPVLLVHGWSQTGAMFRHQVAALSSRHRVIVPDLRGHGFSDKPVHGYRIARLAEDLVELLDQLGVTSAAMLGWSMGAAVLWSLIESHGTARVSRLVIVDEPACVVRLPGMDDRETAEAGAIFDLAGLDGLIAGLLGPGSDEVRRGFVAGMLTPGVDPGLLDWIIAQNLLMPKEAAATLLLHHASQDWRSLMPRIDVPTLVIGGEASHVNPESQRWIARQVAGARLEVFPANAGGAHFPFLENPGGFNRVLADFLAPPSA